MPIHSFFLLNGVQWVDYIGRFENLSSDWKHVCSKMTNFSSNLPMYNSSNHKNYHEYYTDKDIEKVYNKYKIEIDYLNYKF